VPGALREIADPTRWPIGLHDDEIDFVFFEEVSEKLSVRGCIEERVLLGFGVKEAAHGIEFSELEGENFHRRSFLGLGLEICDALCCNRNA